MNDPTIQKFFDKSQKITSQWDFKNRVYYLKGSRNTEGGFVPPILVPRERDYIPNPEEGAMVYDPVNHLVSCFNGTSWVTLVPQSLGGDVSIPGMLTVGGIGRFTNPYAFSIGPDAGHQRIQVASGDFYLLNSSDGMAGLYVKDLTCGGNYYAATPPASGALIEGAVGIGTSSPATSALLDLTSTSKAILLPRLTTTQRDALTPVDGMVIYNTTLSLFQFREDGAWRSFYRQATEPTGAFKGDLWFNTSTGLLQVWSGPNLIPYAEDLSASGGWSIALASVVTDTTTAPDGTSTADLLKEDSSTGFHYVTRGCTLAYANETYTYSIYAKAAGRSWFYIQMNNLTPAYYHSYYDVTNGVLGYNSGGVTATITSVGSGWYRCALSFPAGSGASAPAVVVCMAEANGVPSYTGNGTSGVYYWGSQLERRGFVTNYDKTGIEVHGRFYLGIPNKTPASAAASGLTGEVCWDSSYIYVCTAMNTWKRAGIAAW